MALAATRALGRSGIPVAVLAKHPWAPSWRSGFCAEAIEAPDADQGEAYLAFLESLVREREYSGLFFCDDRTALQVGRQRERFLPYISFLLPKQESLELTLNKTAMMRFARQIDIALPLTAYPEDVDDIEPTTRGMRYPLLVKGSGGFASSHLRVVRTPAAAREAFLELQTRQRSDGYSEMPHLQEYVSGPVFSTLAICRQGEPLAVFMMQKLRTFPVWGGVSVEAESVQDRELERVVRYMLEKLSWHGVIEIEFVRDPRDGGYLLIEPSPDPNWGLDLAIAAGLNVPFVAWQLMQGICPSAEQLRYAVSKRFVWFFPEGVQHMLTRPWAALPMLLSAMDPRVASDVRQSDWRPLSSLLRRTMWCIRWGR